MIGLSRVRRSLLRSTSSASSARSEMYEAGTLSAKQPALHQGTLHTGFSYQVLHFLAFSVGIIRLFCTTPLPRSAYLRGLAQFIPIARFCAEEHRARVDGRVTARHLHGIIERAVRCDTVKVSAESAGAVASTMFLESLPTRQSGRLAQPDGGAGTPAGRGCHLQGRSAPPSWTTP